MPTGTSASMSDSWTSAIFTSTSCLRRQDPAAAEPCLSYLYHLEAQLRLSLSQYDDGDTNAEGLGLGVEPGRDNDGDDDDDEWGAPPPIAAPDWFSFHNTKQTEFTVRSLSSPPPDTGMNATIHLDCRRILIRILTSQSECLSLQASSLRKSKQWKHGADLYQSALDIIHRALYLADAQITKFIVMSETARGQDGMMGTGMGMMDTATATYDDRNRELVQDADTVSIAVSSLADGRQSFLQSGRKEELTLLRQLEPQWEARDEIKRRMGVQRWTNNTSPKNHHAEQRKGLEVRYKEVKHALYVLETMDVRLNHAMERSRELKSQLFHGSTTAGTNHVDQQQQQQQQQHQQQQQQQTDHSLQRYNGLRPDLTSLTNRVSIIDYPDPTQYNWQFTGSCSNSYVEFFETQADGIIKLDWYYTTATVKTSMDHPTLGKTQLFRSKVNPTLYKQILENPRIHTDRGYQERRNRRNAGRNNNRRRRTGRGRN